MKPPLLLREVGGGCHSQEGKVPHHSGGVDLHMIIVVVVLRMSTINDGAVYGQARNVRVSQPEKVRRRHPGRC